MIGRLYRSPGLTKIIMSWLLIFTLLVMFGGRSLIAVALRSGTLTYRTDCRPFLILFSHWLQRFGYLLFHIPDNSSKKVSFISLSLSLSLVCCRSWLHSFGDEDSFATASRLPDLDRLPSFVSAHWYNFLDFRHNFYWGCSCFMLLDRLRPPSRNFVLPAWDDWVRPSSSGTYLANGCRTFLVIF